MLDAIIGALLPVVVTLLLGTVAGWRHDEDAKAAGALNTMVLRYALPLSLFVGTVSTPRATLLAQAPLALILLIGMAVPFALAFAVARFGVGRPLGTAALQALGFGFPAIPFTGIPILMPLIGHEALVVVAIGGVVSNIILVPATLVLLSMAGDGSGSGGEGGRRLGWARSCRARSSSPWCWPRSWASLPCLSESRSRPCS